MDEPIIYGEIVRGDLVAPTHCAITGLPLQSGDATVKITGTRFFFGVKSEAMRELTPEKRAEIVARAPKDSQPELAATPAPARAPKVKDE